MENNNNKSNPNKPEKLFLSFSFFKKIQFTIHKKQQGNNKGLKELQQ